MIDLLFLIKPLFDTLEQYKIFNLSLILAVIILFIFNFPRIRFTLTTSLMLLVYLLFVRSYLIDINQPNTAVFLKITSAFLLFYLAQFNKNPQKTLKIMAWSFLIPIVLTIFMALTGKGFILWGDKNTFVGPYFYKTDLAISVTLSAIFFRYFLYFVDSRIIKTTTIVYLFLIVPWLIYISNSRMLMTVYFFLFVYLSFEFLTLNHVKITRSIKSFALSILIIIAILGFNLYNSMASAENLLSISLDQDEVFSVENTQGRSGIWESTLSNFFDGTFSQVLLGFPLNGDLQLNSYLSNDAHNTYLKVLVATGSLGFLTYIISLLFIIVTSYRFHRFAKNQRELSFLSHTINLIFVFYLFTGMTQSNIIYTQTSWYAFYFIGLLFNKEFMKNHKRKKLPSPLQ